MDINYHERIFKQAWTEHQKIRLILAEIQSVLGQCTQTQTQQADETRSAISKQLSHRLVDLINQLSKRFTYEGANGEVAITLACDRYLHSDVADLTSRWKRLERELRDLLDVCSAGDDSDILVERLGKAFPQLSSDLGNYLPDKMDALRKSLVSVRELVSIS